MQEIMKLNSIPKAFSFLLALGSIGLMTYGIYCESYWAGFGLVLLMPALLLIVSLSYAD